MALHKILVVDDSATERFFFAELLSKNGYDVVTAENGAEAVTKAKSENPDLILMDVVMPGQNGFQVTRTISRDPGTSHIPIIICTSKGQETDRYWGMKQGARDYVVKPVDTDDLMAKIKSLG
jgi:twitching motility two-component system response regulator PilH